MLTITRRIGQSICVGNNVRITVLRTNGNQIRIGVDAPKEVPVHREEVYERIKQKRALATGSQSLLVMDR
ncbi:MAG: carbon storage regulator CsrA [Gammaproteobacteria bacterium]|nr:carbon storage regulator CsrA [Gammaproteobacteria bacterium]